MRVARFLPVYSLAFLAACGTVDSVAGPDLGPDDALQAQADKKIKLDKDQKKACRRTPLTLSVSAEITAADCLYDLAGRTQYEDLYSVRPADLVKEAGAAVAGSPKLTFTAAAAFDGLFGFTAEDKDPFAGLVLGSRTFAANTPRVFSVVGGEKEYGLFFSGYDETQLGGYALSTSVSAGGSWQCGELVFLAGSASFSGNISPATGCAGTIQFGPNAGNPLYYQYRYAKLEAGKSYTATISGIDPNTPAVTLFMAHLLNGGGTVDETLNLSAFDGDTDRSITLTASVTGYYYVEVSTIPGQPADFHFSFTEN